MNTTLLKNEITLLELFNILWKKKIIILATTFLFTIISGIYAFTAKEKWTSTAEVIGAQLSDVESYLKVGNEYNRIIGRDSIDINNLRDSLFSKFNHLLYSSDERKTFFLQSPIFKKLSADKDQDTSRKLLAELLESIKITKPDAKKEPDLIGNRITFSAETPLEAQETLLSFINYVNDDSSKLEMSNFLIFLQEKIEALKFESTKIEKSLSIQKDVKLENLNNAFNIAEKAGIKNYSSFFSDGAGNLSSSLIATSDTKIPLSDSKLSDSNYLFMLGEKYLKAQIDVITSQKIIYPPRYYEINEQLRQLEPLFEKTKGVTIKTFSYQASPDYPVQRDWPKRILLLLVGIILGGIVGSCWVLSSIYLNKK